jgi:WD40 repeat protein/tRNA A-37 threonylcarbamoyl transferase component Bud32
MTSHDAEADDERLLREAFGFDLDDEAWIEKLRTNKADAPLGWLGPYELLAELGRGGQGVVYKARQPKTQRIIALKLTGPVAASSATFRIRFEREIRTAAALKHPNIVTVFGGDVIDGRPVLLMEFVDGTPIDRWVAGTDHGSQRDPRRIAALFERLCATVAHAHQRGVIHRDLKPSNVLVDAAGEPRILDFGLARLLSPFATESLFATHTTAFVGTPVYASPEHFADEESAVDVRSDVYAVGVMLYQAMTGQLPYSTKLSFSGLMKAIQGRDPPRPTSIAPQLDREVEAIIIKALAKDKRERYQSMDALAEDLRRYLAGETVLAHPPGTIYQMRKMIRRHRLAFLLIAGFIVLIVAFAMIATTLAVREHTARQNADWNAYTAGIAAASAALRADEAAAAQAHLRRAPEPLRNWEWRHFAYQADSSVGTASAPDYVQGLDVTGHPIVGLTDEALSFYGSAGRPCAAILSKGGRFLSPRLRYALHFGDGSWSPSASRETVSTGSHKLTLLDVATNSAIAEWPALDIQYLVRFSPDETVLAMTSWSGTLHVLRIPDSWTAPDAGAGPLGTQARSLTEADLEQFDLFDGAMHGLAFSPDSRLIAVNGDEGRICIVDLATRQVLQTLDSERAAFGLAFSPDGAALAIGSWAKRITLWDWASGSILWSTVGHRELITDLAFSPDGAVLASASWDKSICVWSSASGELQARFVGHEAEIETLAFLDSDRIMSCDRNRTLKTWSLSASQSPAASGEFQRIDLLALPGGSPRAGWLAVSESPNETWRGARVSLIDLYERRKIANYPVATKRALALASVICASPGGTWLAAGTDDGSVLFWRGEDLAVTAASREPVQFPEPAGNLPPQDPCAELTTGQHLTYQVSEPACAVKSLSFGADDRSLALGRYDGAVELWDIERQEMRWRRQLEGSPCSSLCAFGPDEGQFAVVTGLGRLQILRARDGRVLVETHISAQGYQNPHYLVLSPDGSLLAPSLHEKDIVLYNTRDLSVAARLQGHTRQVWRVAFSPDGTRLASAAEDGLKLWDVASGREVAMLYGHDYTVTCVVFSPDGGTLISGGYDNTVRFWDAAGQ